MNTYFRRGRLLLCFAVTLSIAASAVGQAPDADLKKLQGTWVCVATLKDGKAVQSYVGVKAVIIDTDLTWHFPQKDGSVREQKNKFRIDSAKNPKHFNWWREGKTEANADQRIYSVDGDTLKWGTNLDYKTRPASFDKAVWQFTVKRVRDSK